MVQSDSATEPYLDAPVARGVVRRARAQGVGAQPAEDIDAVLDRDDDLAV